MFTIKLELADLLVIIKEYNPEEVEVIKKAYYFAEELYKGQVRQSGEPYISHPLNVAYILAEFHARVVINAIEKLPINYISKRRVLKGVVDEAKRRAIEAEKKEAKSIKNLVDKYKPKTTIYNE